MKKINLILLSLLILSSCSKDSNDPAPTNIDCNGVENGTSLTDDCGDCQQAYIYNMTSHAVTLLDDTTGVVLPGCSLGLGIPFAPARKLLDNNCKVSIASDWNPGSAPMGDLLMQASLLGSIEKLSNALRLPYCLTTFVAFITGIKPYL